MFPSIPRRRAALAALATAAALPVFAAGAQASLGPITGTSSPKGQVTLDTVPFGLSVPSDGISTASFTKATAKFTWYNGAVAAHLTGTLHVDGGQNAQFRLRVDGLTYNNGAVGTPVYDEVKGTQITSSSQDIPVDLAVPSAPDLGKLKIAIEEKSSSPKWTDRGEYYAQVVPHTDDVTILDRHLDVGGVGFANGAPTGPASVAWAVGEDGALTATYRGYLHFQGFSGSARVQLRAIDPLTGLPGTSADGPTHSSNGTGHDVSGQDTVSLTSSSASAVRVVMQSWVAVPGEAGGGHWDDIGSQTVSAEE
jgi:hypothetical protein